MTDRCHNAARIVLFILLAIVASPRGSSAQRTSSAIKPDSNPTFVLRQFSAGQPLRLIAYGDMRFTDPKITEGTNPRVRQWLAQKIGQEKPQALLVTGDMPFIGDKKADWEEYQRETASWKEGGFPVFPTMGNHEIYHEREKGIQNYLDNYPMLERHRYYSAVLGSVEVLSLDLTEPVSARSEQGRWFVAQLEHLPASVDFLLILYHIPWVADTQSQLVASLPSKDSLYLRGVVEEHVSHMHARVLVFSGHIHNYERFERHGVEYIVTGGGGAAPYPILFRGSHDLYRDTGFPVYNYVTLEVKDHQLHGVMWKVIDPDAANLDVEAKDSFTVKANATAQPRAKKP